MRKLDFANIVNDFPDVFEKIYRNSIVNMDMISKLIENIKCLYLKQLENLNTKVEVSNQQSMDNNNKNNIIKLEEKLYKKNQQDNYEIQKVKSINNQKNWVFFILQSNNEH